MRVTTSIFALSTAGCAVQLAGGADTTSTDSSRDMRNVMSVGGQIQTDRHVRTSLASLRMNMTADLGDRPVHVKSVVGGIGIRWAPRRPAPLGVGWELALEGGAGAPTTKRFDGIGAYAGARGAMLYRVYGSADVEEGYSLGYLTIDLVPMIRGGTWGLPEGSDQLATLGEAGAELGLRFNLGSDLLGGSKKAASR